LFCFLRD